MNDRLVLRHAPDRLRSRFADVPGLAEWLAAQMGDDLAPVRFGPTYADPDADAFWDLTTRAQVRDRLDADRQLVRLVVSEPEWTDAEAEAVLRATNARRLQLGAEHPHYDLLSALVDEVTTALLDDA